MAFNVALFTGSGASWATEFSLTNNSTTIATQTTVGTFQVVLGLQNLALGDAYELRVYEKVRAADAQLSLLLATFNDAQGTDSSLIFTPPIILGAGWDFTLKNIAGTATRTITWSIRGIT